MKTSFKSLWILLFFIPIFSIAQQHEKPSFELYALNNETTISCEGNPVVLSIKKSDKDYSFRLVRNNELYLEVTSSETEVFLPGNYFAIVDLGDTEVRTNTILISKCDLDISSLSKNDNSDNINLINASISSKGYALCGELSSVVLNASPKGTEYSYKWYYSSTNSGVYETIIDSTSDSISVNQTGYYKVMIEDGVDAPGVSSPFSVSSQVITRLTDLNGSLYSTLNVTSGDSVELNVEALGQTGPLSVRLRVGLDGFEFASQVSPFKIKVPVYQNVNIYLTRSESECGLSYNFQGQIKAIVDEDLDIQYQIPLNSNVCSGQLLEIPFTLEGEWGNTRSIYYSIYEKNSGSYIIGKNGLYNSPLEIKVPNELELGKSYRLYLSVQYPAIASQSVNVFLNVTSEGCTARPTIVVSPSNESCGAVRLITESRTGNVYQWYKNNNIISGANASQYDALETGNYKVQVSNQGESYYQTSSNYPIVIKGGAPTIESLNPSLCSATAGALIESTPSVSPVLKYEWLYTPYSYGTPFEIPNANSSTYTANVSGFFKLRTSTADGCITESNTIEILESGGIQITDASSGESSSTINPGGTAYLKIKFQGEAPYFLYYIQNDIRKYINTDQPEYILAVSPEHTKNYEFRLLSTGCGVGSDYQYYKVNVGASTSFDIAEPSNLNYCPGGRVIVPYTTFGTWGSERLFFAYLTDENGNYINNSERRIYPGSSSYLNYEIRNNISPGSYFLNFYTSSPYLLNHVKSTFKINVSSSGCSLPTARLEFKGVRDKCSNSSYYEVYPSVDGAAYKWYYNGSLIQTTSSPVLYTSFGGSASGQLTARVEKIGTYNSLSNAITVAQRESTGLYEQRSSNLCDLNTITSYFQYSSGYQWYFAESGFGYEQINGANSFSHTPSQRGYYLLKSEKLGCELVEEFYCNRGIDLEFQKICTGGSLVLKYHGEFDDTLKFQLVNVSNGAVVESNLFNSILDNYWRDRTSTVTLPMSIPIGEYRVRMLVENTSQTFDSQRTLEILPQAIAQNPTIAITPPAIAGSEVVNVSLSGCGSSHAIWSNGYSQNSFSTYSNPGSTFRAYCQSFDGCVSKEIVKAVDFLCTDIYEPNNLSAESGLIDSLNFVSSPLCFINSTDSDWFKFVENGRAYFVEIRPYSSGTSIGERSYKFSKTQSGGQITLQTDVFSGGLTTDTYMTLYDSELNEIAANDDGNGVFSKIVFNPSNPCQSMVNLVSPSFDLYSGQSSYVKSIDFITASNIQNDKTINQWEAGKSILLEPGFETKIEIEGVFKTEIKNCEN